VLAVIEHDEDGAASQRFKIWRRVTRGVNIRRLLTSVKQGDHILVELAEKKGLSKVYNLSF
jgi:hypothetical protein